MIGHHKTLAVFHSCCMIGHQKTLAVFHSCPPFSLSFCIIFLWSSPPPPPPPPPRQWVPTPLSIQQWWQPLAGKTDVLNPPLLILLRHVRSPRPVLLVFFFSALSNFLSFQSFSRSSFQSSELAKDVRLSWCCV